MRAQREVWEYIQSSWIHRNKLVHGKEDEKQQQIHRMQVEEQVQRTYDDLPDVGRRQCFAKPLHKTLQRSTRVLEAWLVDVDTATRVQEYSKEQQQKSACSIQQYFKQKQQDTTNKSDRTVRRWLHDSG